MHSAPPNTSFGPEKLGHCAGFIYDLAAVEYETQRGRVHTHHVFDLREGDLQGDVQSAVRVLYRPQRTGIILHQIIQELLGIAALRRVNHWTERCRVPSELYLSDDNTQTSPSGSSITKQITGTILSTSGQHK